jgi:hypothetical protein
MVACELVWPYLYIHPSTLPICVQPYTAMEGRSAQHRGHWLTAQQRIGSGHATVCLCIVCRSYLLSSSLGCTVCTPWNLLCVHWVTVCTPVHCVHSWFTESMGQIESWENKYAARKRKNENLSIWLKDCYIFFYSVYLFVMYISLMRMSYKLTANNYNFVKAKIYEIHHEWYALWCRKRACLKKPPT